MAISSYLAEIWSATEFRNPDLAGYAEERIRTETRLGIQTMAGLSLMMQLFLGLLILNQELGAMYLYTSALFAALSLHILISVAFVNDVRTMQMLGMTFLIIGALTITVLAHRSGDLNIGTMTAVVMLFVAIPLVPWALREAALVISLTYALLTLSFFSVPGRFEANSLWALQLLVFGAAVIAVVITGRNTFIRKQDLRARFELETAHDEMHLLTMKDHLTGAWNRRFLAERFPQLARTCEEAHKELHVAVLDIDDFKGINDQFGHQVGDQILMSIAVVFMRHLEDNGWLIRLGGDEFQILYCGDGLEELIEQAIRDLQNSPIAKQLARQRKITLSAGIVSSAPNQTAELNTLYKTADEALYRAKQERFAGVHAVEGGDGLAKTGTWRL